MFRRKWSGLPKDPHFPSDMKELGYFINEDDEIRQIEEPDNYFKYFLTKNVRYNERQRFAMNEAIEKVVHSRLVELGLRKVLLPLSAAPSEPHTPIFVSKDIKNKSRVVIIFGESYQDLGILAHRVIGGPGGVNKGSMVSVVKEILKQRSSATDPAPPGIILANMGQLIWSPELKRSLTITGAEQAPMPSAVHGGMLIGAENRVPENQNQKEHAQYIFEKVVPALLSPKAGLDIIAIGDSADAVEGYLNWGVTWSRIQGRVNCLAILGSYHPVWDLQCESFKTFLAEKACGWITSSEPLGTIISGPEGNPNTTVFTQLGCPLLSGGEPYHVEVLLIQCHQEVLAWIQKVALSRGDYKNPVVHIPFADEVRATDVEPDWTEYVEEHKQWEKDAPAREEAERKKEAEEQAKRDLMDSDDEDDKA